MFARGTPFLGIFHRLAAKCVPSPSTFRPLSSPSSFTPMPNTEKKKKSTEAEFRPSDEFYKSQNAQNREILDKLVKQITLLCYVHDRVPSAIGDKDWEKMMSIRTTNGILSHLNFMVIKEKAKLKDRLDREQRQSPEAHEARERANKEASERQARGEIVYTLSKNNMLLRQTKNRMCAVENAKLAAMIRLRATPTLLIDCEFLPLLSDKALGRTGVQMQYLMSSNNYMTEPWEIGFVHFDRQTPRMADYIKGYLMALEENKEDNVAREEQGYRYPRIDPMITKQSYLDLYPRERLVYLTPDAREELHEIDSDAVYIMGGIVDVDMKNTRGHPDALEHRATLAKAKQYGIRAAKLPLDRYVKWQTGSRMLPLNIVHAILADTYTSRGDWRYSLLKNISNRKLKSVDERNQYHRGRYQNYNERNKEAIQMVRSTLNTVEPEELDRNDRKKWHRQT